MPLSAFRLSRLSLGVLLAAAALLFLPWAGARFYELRGLGLLALAGAHHGMCALFGGAVLGRVCPSLVGKLERWVLGWLLGLAGVGHMMFLLGHAGLFVPAAAVVVPAVAALGAALEGPRLKRLRLPPVASPWLPLVGGALAVLVWLSLVPPAFYDAQAYHLGLPMQWAAWGRAVVTEHFLFSAFPLVAELAVSPLLLLTGEPVAFAAGMALLLLPLAALVWITGERTVGSGVGGPAAFIIVTMPLVVFLVQGTKPDLMTGAAACGVLYVLGATAREAGGGLRPHEAARLFGLMLGVLCATKTSALPAAGSLALAALAIPAWRRSFGGARVLLIEAGIAGALLAAPVYVANAVLLSNPTFPLLSSVFGGPPWQAHAVDLVQGSVPRIAGLHDVPALVRLPWDLGFVVREATMINLPGPFVFVAAVLALTLRNLPRSFKRLALATALTAPTWLVTYSILRLAPFLWVFLALVGGLVVARLLEEGGAVRALAIIALAVGTAANAAFALQANDILMKGVWDVRLGRVSEEEWLLRSYEPYGAYRFIDENLERDAVLFLVSDPRIAYLERRAILSEVYTPPRYDVLLREASGPGDFIARMRADGATHVLFSEVAINRNKRHGWLRWSAEEEERFREALAELPLLYDDGRFQVRALP